MLNVIKRFLLLIVELILTLVGVFLMTPLTLWRLPTFLILFKKHEFARKMFFSILLKIYKRMVFDIIELPVKSFSFIISPRHMLKFYKNTILRYGNGTLKEFEKLEELKYLYTKQTFISSFECILVLIKVALIKIFWVRKLELGMKMES